MTDSQKVRPIVTIATAADFEAVSEAFQHWRNTGVRLPEPKRRSYAMVQEILRDSVLAVDYRSLDSARNTPFPVSVLTSRTLVALYGRSGGLEDEGHFYRWRELLFRLFHLQGCLWALCLEDEERPPTQRLAEAIVLAQELAKFIKHTTGTRMRPCTTDGDSDDE